MEDNVYYSRVGLFVLILTLAGFLIVVFFQGHQHQNNHQTYVIYVREAVTGLTPKSQVRYNGVVVGFVESIALEKHNPENIRIVIKIDKETPLQDDTVATLKLQGITGIAYIELKKSKHEAPHLIQKKTDEFPEIAYEPSFLVYINETLHSITDIISRLSSQFDQLLSPGNLDAFSQTLQAVKLSSQQLPTLLKETQAMLKQLQKATADLTPTLSRSLDNLAETTEKFKNISSDIGENPAVLFRGKQAQQPGPGE